MRYDRAFYMIEGDITFIANGKQLQASTGGFIAIPSSTIHSFRVESDTAHILNFYSPAGFEQVVMQMGVLAPTRTIPPADFKEPPVDMTKMMQLFQKYGMHVVQEPDVLHQQH